MKVHPSDFYITPQQKSPGTGTISTERHLEIEHKDLGRCHGETETGRCNCRSMIGSEFCYWHDPALIRKPVARKPRDQERFCKAMVYSRYTRVLRQCHNYADDLIDSQYCRQHRNELTRPNTATAKEPEKSAAGRADLPAAFLQAHSEWRRVQAATGLRAIKVLKTMKTCKLDEVGEEIVDEIQTILMLNWQAELKVLENMPLDLANPLISPFDSLKEAQS